MPTPDSQGSSTRFKEGVVKKWCVNHKSPLTEGVWCGPLNCVKKRGINHKPSSSPPPPQPKGQGGSSSFA